MSREQLSYLLRLVKGGMLERATTMIEQELAKPEQEPVAWIYDWYGYKSQSETKELVKDWIAAVCSEVSDPTIGAHNIRPLYAAPPRKEWVGLTDDDKNACLVEGDPCEALAEPEAWEVMRRVEAKLKELNG